MDDEELIAFMRKGGASDAEINAALMRRHSPTAAGGLPTRSDASRVASEADQQSARERSLHGGFTLGGGIAGGLAGAPLGPVGILGGAALGAMGGGTFSDLLDSITNPEKKQDMSFKGQATRRLGEASSGVINEMLGPIIAKGAGGLARAGAGTLERIANARTSGIPLTAGQALDAPVVKSLENATAVIPTGRGVMGRFGQRQAEAAGARAEELATQLAGGSVPTREEAGIMAQRAAQRVGQEFEQARQPLMERFKGLLNDAFPTASTAAPPTNAELLRLNPNDPALRASLRAHTQAGGTLQSWAALPSAPPTSTGVPLSSTEKLVEEWTKQVGKKSAAKDLQPVLDEATALLDDARNGVLDAGDILSKRTKLGQRANFNSPLVAPDPARTEVKRLWRALSEDLKAAAKAAGPEAEQTLKAHDQMVRGFRESSRINNPAGADFWAAVENAKTPEQAFNLVTNHPNNASAIRAIREKLTPEEFNPIAARHFLDLGKANPTAQTSAGDVFSPETFLTRWNGKGMTPAVQRELYGAGGDLPPTLQSFLKTADELKSSAAYRNPSGTAGMLQGTQLLRDIGTTAQGAAMGGAAVTGHLGSLAATAGVPLVAAKGFTAAPVLSAIEKVAGASKFTGNTLADALKALAPLAPR